MGKRSTDNGRAGAMSRVRRLLEQWRRRSAPRSRIPAPLWATVVDLARVHGVYRTSQALRLDYYCLKKVEAASPEPSARRTPVRRAAAPVPFIEVPLRAAPGPACVIELDDGRGAKLRVELAGIATGDLAGLVGSWGGAVDPGDGADARAGGGRAR